MMLYRNALHCNHSSLFTLQIYYIYVILTLQISHILTLNNFWRVRNREKRKKRNWESWLLRKLFQSLLPMDDISDPFSSKSFPRKLIPIYGRIHFVQTKLITLTDFIINWVIKSYTQKIDNIFHVYLIENDFCHYISNLLHKSL